MGQLPDQVCTQFTLHKNLVDLATYSKKARRLSGLSSTSPSRRPPLWSVHQLIGGWLAAIEGFCHLASLFARNLPQFFPKTEVWTLQHHGRCTQLYSQRMYQVVGDFSLLHCEKKRHEQFFYDLGAEKVWLCIRRSQHTFPSA